MIQDDQVATGIPKFNNISITISSPKNVCGNVTDEDSDYENNPTIDNMTGSQLQAETKVTLNAQGEGIDDYDESHNGDEQSKGDGENGSRNTNASATDIQMKRKNNKFQLGRS
ncbi:hypothetical protein ANN_28083 [Periplaneta americana]|uniref:Uncharacterized protein n=1 Tax=Periplaneta americana TaxID=6978 RepID=A0ABQ8RUX9_PERAM|nr:hypothetical protein ANN_28083 [Periplaneta americana]